MPTKPDPSPHETIGSQFRALTDAVRPALEEMARTCERVIRAIARAFQPLVEGNKLHQLKTYYGPDQFVDEDETVLWQSTMCAVWLHPECPLPDHCDCTCHAGSLR